MSTTKTDIVIRFLSNNRLLYKECLSQLLRGYTPNLSGKLIKQVIFDKLNEVNYWQKLYSLPEYNIEETDWIYVIEWIRDLKWFDESRV